MYKPVGGGPPSQAGGAPPPPRSGCCALGRLRNRGFAQVYKGFYEFTPPNLESFNEFTPPNLSFPTGFIRVSMNLPPPQLPELGGGGKFIQMYSFPKGFQGFRRPLNFMSIPPSRQNAILPRVLKLFDSFGPELGGG